MLILTELFDISAHSLFKWIFRTHEHRPPLPPPHLPTPYMLIFFENRNLSTQKTPLSADPA